MKKIKPTHLTALGELWPHTGRSFPAGACLLVAVVHPNWDDLCWNSGDKIIYISTLPANQERRDNYATITSG